MSMVPGNDTSEGETPSVQLDVPAPNQSDCTGTATESSESASKRSRDEEEMVGRDQSPQESPPGKRSRPENDESQVKSDVSNLGGISNNDKGPPQEESQVSESAGADVCSPVVTRSRKSDKVIEGATVNDTTSKVLVDGGQESHDMEEEQEQEQEQNETRIEEEQEQEQSETRIQGRWRGETVDVSIFLAAMVVSSISFDKFTKWLKITLV
jgi:hypothetical protein